MFKESIPCTVAQMEDLRVSIITNIVPIGLGKDFAPIIMLPGWELTARSPAEYVEN